MIKTILIPLDGSPFSERALPLGCELAKGLGAQIVLVCVAGDKVQPGQYFNDQDQREIAEKYAGVREEDHLLSFEPRMVERAQHQVRAIADAEQYLAGLAAELTGNGYSTETAVPYGDAVDGILTEIDLRKADLVVMSTHGRSRLTRLVLGSVAQEVLSRSPVPVLLVPSRE